MLEKMIHIKVGEIEYPIAFTLNIMEAIQDKYGSMEQWQNSMTKNDEPNVKVVIWSFAEMLNEGIEIENEDTEIKRAKLEQKKVGRIITTYGIIQASKKLKEAVAEFMPKADEDNPNPIANPTQP